MHNAGMLATRLHESKVYKQRAASRKDVIIYTYVAATRWRCGLQKRSRVAGWRYNPPQEADPHPGTWPQMDVGGPGFSNATSSLWDGRPKRSASTPCRLELRLDVRTARHRPRLQT